MLISMSHIYTLMYIYEASQDIIKLMKDHFLSITEETAQSAMCTPRHVMNSSQSQAACHHKSHS
jgi:hypothetical protein